MRGRFLLTMAAIASASGASAQTLPYRDVFHAEHEVGPRLAYQPMETGATALASAAALGAPQTGDGPVYAGYFDRIEYRARPDDDGWAWDLSAEFGSPAHRLWLATAGSASLRGRVTYVEGQALYSHPVLDAGLALQAGVRHDFVRARRTYGVLGLQGNVTAPLYVGAFGYLSTLGEVTGRAYAWYDWEPAPRLVLQPFAGLQAAAQDVPALGLGRGLTTAELGLRVRYRIAEPFAPYVGLSWDRLLGRTARIARLNGGDPEATSLVIGLRSYF
ncbi:copper resistance protein B [Sphingosinicella sp.]|uniref:copper resistance protein B n=1 Tax=Sphingosinicella sp. TaxID=1917971 RepID=UPI0040379496